MLLGSDVWKANFISNATRTKMNQEKRDSTINNKHAVNEITNNNGTITQRIFTTMSESFEG